MPHERSDARLATVVVIAASVLATSLFGPRASVSTVFRTVYNDEINDFGQRLWGHALISGDWSRRHDGLALMPGTAGAVVLAIQKPRRADIDLTPWLYSAGVVENVVECSTDGVRFIDAHRNIDVAGDRLDLSRCAFDLREDSVATAPKPEENSVWIRIASVYPADAGDQQQLVLDRIQLSTPLDGRLVPFRLNSVGLIPPVETVGSVVVTVVVTVWGVMAVGGSRILLVGIAPLVVLLALPISIGWPGWFTDTWTVRHFRVNLVLLATGALLALGGLVVIRRREPGSKAALGTAAMAWLCGAALLGRWQLVLANLSSPLRPDAESVATMTTWMLRHAYDTDLREPLWPWLTRLFQLVWGTTDVSSRLFSLSMSILLLYVVYRFVRDYTGRIGLALLTLAWLVSHPFLVDSAMQGLRTELFSTVLLLTAYFALVPNLRAATRTIGLAGSTALVALAQLSGVATALVLTAWACWRHGLRWWVVPSVATFTVLVVTPHLLNTARTHQDPLYSQNVHAAFYRNLEFVGLSTTGCDGCPTPEEYARYRYAGSRTTTFEYIFGMHDLSDVIQRTASGYRSLYFDRGHLLERLLGSRHPVPDALYLVGVALLVASPMRELLLLPLLSINFLAFLIPLELDPRLVMHPAPVAALAIVLPVWWATRIPTVGLVAAWHELTPTPAAPNLASFATKGCLTRLGSFVRHCQAKQSGGTLDG